MKRVDERKVHSGGEIKAAHKGKQGPECGRERAAKDQASNDKYIEGRKRQRDVKTWLTLSVPIVAFVK